MVETVDGQSIAQWREQLALTAYQLGQERGRLIIMEQQLARREAHVSRLMTCNDRLRLENEDLRAQLRGLRADNAEAASDIAGFMLGEGEQREVKCRHGFTKEVPRCSCWAEAREWEHGPACPCSRCVKKAAKAKAAI